MVMVNRGRYEPSVDAADSIVDDSECDKVAPLAVQLPRAAPPRCAKMTRHVPTSAIGTRTLGRSTNKPSSEYVKSNGQWVISLSARPGRANVLDAFLVVLEVVDESPSWNQGLRSRDLFVNFGGLDKAMFILYGSNLECLSSIVAKSATVPLDCVIIRGQRLFNITLRGMRWDHGVCLGAVINTYPEPTPRSSIEQTVTESLPVNQDNDPDQKSQVPTRVLEKLHDIAESLESRLGFNSLPALHQPSPCTAFEAA